uniref:Myozenin 2b n=1 Tax=Oryzias melastigma TaxID=30732 RepID=A0A3B3DB19_ORYME
GGKGGGRGEKSDGTGMHKTYHTPWEEAILSDPDLAETIKLRMPEPNPQAEVATPYGGFDKAPRGITFKLPEVDLTPPPFPELNEPRMKRPTFNRTAQGWISEGTHLIIPTITLEPTCVPESDDL